MTRQRLITLFGLSAILVVLSLIAVGTAHADTHEERSPVGPLGDAIERGFVDGLVNTVTNDCPPEAPLVQDPQPTLAGIFMTPPTSFPPPKITPDGLYAERGFGGLRTITYDLGCVRTPVDAAEHFSSALENDTSNRVAGIGFAVTALAHDLDARSWDLDWLFTLMTAFAAQALAGVEVGFVLPFVAAGLLFTTLVLLVRARHGQSGPIVLSVVWSLTVLAVGAAIVSSPLLAPRLINETSAGVTQTVYQAEGNPADVVTDRTIEAVHWRGLERRYFGDQVSDVARTNLPNIVEATSWSWEERARIAADPSQEEVIWREKMLQLDSAMGMIREHAPQDYADLSGVKRPRTDAAALEAGYAAAAGVFRIMAAALRVMCMLSLLVLSFLWVAAMPYLVTPQGESAGRTLLGNTVRALGFLLLSIIGSFGFGIFAFAAMDPALPMGLSLVLLILLTILFWAMIRPDRALMNMATMGKVDGVGKSGSRVRKMLMKNLMMQHAVRRGVSKADGRRTTPPEEHIVDDPRFDYIIVDSEVVYESTTPYARPLPRDPSPEPRSEARPSGEVIYGEVELYRRTDEDVDA